MINRCSIFFLFTFTTLHSFAYAKIHEYQTTRTKSVAGGGVGSVLLEESAFLNPASISFFQTSSIFAQKDNITTTDNANSSFPEKSSLGFVLAQGDPSLAGTFSYINQKEGNIQRRRFGISMSSPMSNTSSLGFSVRDSKDTDSTTNTTAKYYQTVFGVTHIMSNNTSMGIVLYDPFKSKAKETKLLIGFQHNLFSYITAMFDVGADYNAEEISKKTSLSGAVQIRVLDDFYLRAAGFNDKIKNEQGESYGIAWIQPRLAFEFAIKNTKDKTSNIEQKNKETSFSISLRGI